MTGVTSSIDLRAIARHKNLPRPKRTSLRLSGSLTSRASLAIVVGVPEGVNAAVAFASRALSHALSPP